MKYPTTCLSCDAAAVSTAGVSKHTVVNIHSSAYFFQLDIFVFVPSQYAKIEKPPERSLTDTM